MTNIKERFDYDRKNILNDLLKRKDQYEKELYALRSIKRVYKKDWSDFQSFIKNFSYDEDVSVSFDSSYKLFWTDIKFRYKWEHVRLENVSTNKEFLEKIRATAPDRIIKETLLCDRVYYTPDEFMEHEVKKAIEWRENALSGVTIAITKFDIICWELYEKIEPLLKYIKSIEYEAYSFKKLADTTISTFYDYK